MSDPQLDPLTVAVDRLIAAVNDLTSTEDSTVFGLALSNLIEQTLSRSSTQAAGASVLFYQLLDKRISLVSTEILDLRQRLDALQRESQ